MANNLITSVTSWQLMLMCLLIKIIYNSGAQEVYGQDPSDSKSNLLHVGIIFRFCYDSFERVYSSIDSSKMIGNSLEVSNRLFLKLHRFICNWPPVLPGQWPATTSAFIHPQASGVRIHTQTQKAQSTCFILKTSSRVPEKTTTVVIKRWLGPLPHTRLRAHDLITLQALSLVEKPEPVQVRYFTLRLRAGANQPVHWCLGGKGLGIQQETSVWVGSPKLRLRDWRSIQVNARWMVKSTWIPTWHRMDHVTWLFGLFSKTISWR